MLKEKRLPMNNLTQRLREIYNYMLCRSICPDRNLSWQYMNIFFCVELGKEDKCKIQE